MFALPIPRPAVRRAARLGMRVAAVTRVLLSTGHLMGGQTLCRAPLCKQRSAGRHFVRRCLHQSHAHDGLPSDDVEGTDFSVPPLECVTIYSVGRRLITSLFGLAERACPIAIPRLLASAEPRISTRKPTLPPRRHGVRGAPPLFGSIFLGTENGEIDGGRRQ